MSKRIGYAQVSTDDQNLDMQRAALLSFISTWQLATASIASGAGIWSGAIANNTLKLFKDSL